MTRKEASSIHSSVYFAILSWVCRHNLLTPAFLPLFRAVYVRCKARARRSMATYTSSSLYSLIRVTSCGHQPTVRPPATRMTLTLMYYHRREVIIVVSVRANNTRAYPAQTGLHSTCNSK